MHLHAGSWKAGKELNASRLLERAVSHAQAGRHEQAAGVLKRVGMHASAALSAAAVEQVWTEFFASFVRAGRPAKAHLDIAHDRLAQRQYDEAIKDLADAEGLASRMGQAGLRADAHMLRALALSRRAIDADAGSAVGSATPPPAAAQADVTAAAAAELRSAMALQPAASRPQLAWAVHRLRSSAVHAAEAVPELAKAIDLEREERSGERSGRSGAHGAANAAPFAAASMATPLSAPHVLYLWHSAPMLRQAMEALPTIAAVLDALRDASDPTARTPCDLEASDGASLPPTPSARPTLRTSEARRGSGNPGGTIYSPHLESVGGRAGRTVALLPVDAAEAARLDRPTHSRNAGATLCVNEFGVPSLDFTGRPGAPRRKPRGTDLVPEPLTVANFRSELLRQNLK